MDGKDAKVIENSEGARTTPSIVGFTDDEKLVGQPAKRQAVTNPEKTLFAVKRLIGRIDDPMVEKDKDMVPYSIVDEGNGDAWVKSINKIFPQPSFSLHFKMMLPSYLGQDVSQAVITVPAMMLKDKLQKMQVIGA